MIPSTRLPLSTPDSTFSRYIRKDAIRGPIEEHYSLDSGSLKDINSCCSGTAHPTNFRAMLLRASSGNSIYKEREI